MLWGRIGSAVIGLIPSIVHVVETVQGAKGKKGSEKQQAYLNAILEAFRGYKSASGKDVLNDPRVLAKLAQAGDALVAVQNVIAQVEAE